MTTALATLLRCYLDALAPRLKEAAMPRGFKRWFGNSKVVDDQGRPLLVYHGTKDRSFTEFDVAKIKSGVGFWFTNDQYQALGHTQSIDRRGRTIHGRVIEAYLSIQNPATTAGDYMRGTDADGNAYDGYIRPEHGLYVAFRSDQIKIVNQGLDEATMREASNFKPGRFATFYAQVRREASMMFGVSSDEENELTKECVRAWIVTHRQLFSRSRIVVYRAMAMTDQQMTDLQPGGALGTHWSFELQPENFDGFDIGGAKSVVVFEAEIGAKDVFFPLTVAYNCLFPNENELFLYQHATPIIRSIRNYSMTTGQFDEPERADLVGKGMRI